MFMTKERQTHIKKRGKGQEKKKTVRPGSRHNRPQPHHKVKTVYKKVPNVPEPKKSIQGDHTVICLEWHSCMLAINSSILFKWLSSTTHSLIVGVASVFQDLGISICVAGRRKRVNPFLVSPLESGYIDNKAISGDFWFGMPVTKKQILKTFS